MGHRMAIVVGSLLVVCLLRLTTGEQQYLLLKLSWQRRIHENMPHYHCSISCLKSTCLTIFPTKRMWLFTLTVVTTSTSFPLLWVVLRSFVYRKHLLVRFPLHFRRGEIKRNNRICMSVQQKLGTVCHHSLTHTRTFKRQLKTFLFQQAYRYKERASCADAYILRCTILYCFLRFLIFDFFFC